MATYHNEKTLSEIALVNCFNKITANGIRTAEQLRQTEYYQEAIEAIYNFVRDAALKTKKSKDMLKASGLEDDDVAGSFIIACMEKDGKINGLLKCQGEYSAYLCRCLANYIIDLSRHGTRKTKDAERERIVTAIDDQTLEMLLERETDFVCCEQLEALLETKGLTPIEKLMSLFLDNTMDELVALYNSTQDAKEFVRALNQEAELLYGAEQLSDEELLDAIYTLAKSDNPQSSIRCARYRARKKLAKGSEKQKERCRSLKLKKVS